SIRFGYLPIPEANSAEAERPILNEMIVEKAGDLQYRYGRQRFNGHDPSAQTEDIGDDPIYASTLGIANLKRIVPKLTEWSGEEAKFYENLEELYGQVINQLNRYSGHVASNIGGVYEHQRSADEDKTVYRPVSTARQLAAVAFVNQEILTTPEWLVNKNILERIAPVGVVERIKGLQNRALARIFQVDRLNRLVEQRAVYGPNQFGVDRLMEEVSSHIFRRKADEDAYGRELQRNFITAAGKLLREDDLTAEAKAVTRFTLANLQFRFQGEVDHASIKAAHRAELVRLIEQALDGTLGLLEKGGKTVDAFSEELHRGCWHD
ncbi:MAG: zinc-dependent metalloprotease, partial [Bacteroidota bacterium]